jgi:hypothetical protein
MKYLVAIFVALTIYGVAANKLGGAMFSAGMALFVVYGARQLAKRDAEFAADPAHARVIPDTWDLLKEKEVEGGASML